jgi:hypothetical protein|tara:strand:+ start:479 stop:910 length:432 start_codon:yes stop_codon:yes gene_type:complete
MASTYTHPEEKLAYFIRGDHLAIVTTRGETSGTTHSLEGQYKPIDEAVTNGILIHYYGEPNAVSAITDTPDVDNVFHNSIIDYVKAALYRDKAGTVSDGNLATVSLNLSQIHDRKFQEAVKKNGMRKRDKTGGSRAVLFPDLT